MTTPSDGTKVAVRWHVGTVKALDRLREDPASPVCGRTNNYILNWSVQNVYAVLRMQRELEEYLPLAKVREIRERFEKYAPGMSEGGTYEKKSK